MALVSTLNFLPPVFRSDTNQRFLGATLDQLVTDSYNVPVNGYIGRTFSPTYKQGDNYVPEPTPNRAHYQLEPSVVIRNSDQDIVFNTTYPDLLQNINNYNGVSDNQSRLFKTESYNYDSHIDYNKFVNYNNYYWLPDGPAAVAVSSTGIPYQANYTVTRNTNVAGYTFSGAGAHPNTQLTLARGGRYTFVVDQPGFKFWIQNEPGVSGVDVNVPTVSTRTIFGVKNNGTDSGTITFNVPLATAQDFYVRMPIVASVDAATMLHYNQVQGRLLSQFLKTYPEGFDGVNNQLLNKKIIFINNDVDDSYWTVNGITASVDKRRKTWRINLIPTGLDDYIIELLDTDAVVSKEKVFVNSGNTYASTQFWLDNNELYNVVPAITAPLNYLFYQDESNPDFVGEIKLVDNQSTPIDVTNDILGKVGYTSPNGVIFTNGLKITFDSLVVPSSYANKEYYVEGVGTSIQLVDVSQLIVPETFSADINSEADYITINRASQDQNPWSRTNRWFHVDVLNAVAKYNNTSVNYGPNISGRRPIVEFEPNLQLFSYGKQAKDNIDLIVFDATDAFNDYEGKTTAVIQGVTLVNDQRIVFANDYDTNVTNKIWRVQIDRIADQLFIRLLETADDPVLAGENMLVKQGTYTGKTFCYNGISWTECQAKTQFNQAPLFDLVDANGYSFADTTVYPGSTFIGTRFFGYQVGTGSNDVLLGFPVVYQNFNNIGDIVFKNYYDADTFTHGTTTAQCNSGYLVKNTGLTVETKLNNWVTGVESSEQYQVFSKFYDGLVITINGVEKAFVQIDILPATQATVPYLKVFKNNTLLTPSTDYFISKVGIYNVVALNTLPTIGDKIDVLVFNDISISNNGYYVVPENLDFNPLNENFDTITLGQLRTHYNKLLENTAENNIPPQDQYLKAQGGTLMQHSGPVLYAMTFLNDPLVNFVDGITLARKEYQRFKNKFLQSCTTLQTLDYNDPIGGVDLILSSINSVKNSSFPWYYSDMVPYGPNYSTITYSVLNTRQTQYEISSIFDDNSLSNRAVLVYYNGEQLTKGIDYTFSSTVPAVIVSKPLTFGGTLVIRDYSNTDGNYIPETPTKLGMYAKFHPEIYSDSSYRTPTNVLRGHDGSLTPVFGDFRDAYLLELERRIYNNIKTNYQTNMIDLHSIMPGRFRSTGYSLNEWNQFLDQNFLNWVGVNNIDYTNNTWFNSSDPWTWNYNKFTDIVDGSFLQGSWRAIYQYWFDTDTPNTAPWEMLGFEVEPAWWQERYGPAPYTGGNTTLWSDLEAGYIWNNGSAYNDLRFARPGLTSFVPVDAAGNLLSPIDAQLIKQYNLTSGSSNFSVGEQSPSETAWRRSSDFPYAIQMAIALARPAEYFATQIDTSRFYRNRVTNQFSDINNQKVSPSILTVNGDTTLGTVQRTSGYINWIGDYLKNLGMDPVAKINLYLQNLDVNLTYKVAGFTDKNMITVAAEQTSPGSVNSSVIIPDNNYDVYLSKSVPVKTVTYSAVIIEKTTAGYSVSGYDIGDPFFGILPSIADNSSAAVVTINNLSVKLYQKSNPTESLISYGTTFATVQQVADFLISYERQLVANGFIFSVTDPDLGEVRNWTLSVKEFLFWAQQGWDTGTIIVLNPSANKLSFASVGSIVDEISNLPNKGMLLDQNFLPIKNNQFNILRTETPKENFFQITSLSGASIGFSRFNLVQTENTLVFDNVSDFGDIIYVPAQGTRQYRLKATGFKTGAWTGALSAAGYVYSDPSISEWKTGKDYRRGDLVDYNGLYYTASANNIPASQTFNFSNWSQIRSTDIQSGLLPSLGTLAQSFTRIYEIDLPSQDETLQTFSSGLIGFRERPYLTDLGMSIPTQTKFYQGYIKQKGTVNAINALTKATFNNATSNINTYEEWAFRVGTYGDVNGNQYTEFVLDQSEFLNDPVAFTLTTNTYTGGNLIANLAVNTYSYTGNLTSNVYQAGNILNVSTSLYNNRTTDDYVNDLPTVGYVNVDDIDYTIFDLNSTISISNPGSGKKVWVAKDYNQQWNVFRISETDLEATDLVYALDSYGKLTFDKQHDLTVDDFFILEGFDDKFDGLYRVVNIPTAISVTIILQNPTALIATSSKTSGSGIVYKLTSSVIDSITDINNVRPLHNWEPLDRVWVNNATTEGWGVYTFTYPWSLDSDTQLTADTITANARFGSAVRISSDEQYYYVGDPGQSQVKIFSTGDYNSNVTISNVNARFGSKIEAQGNLLVVASTSTVQVYQHNGSITPAWKQTISSANITAVTSVTLSADQHWLHIGSLNNNTVESYYAANVAAPYYSWVKKTVGTANSRFGEVVKTNSDGTLLFVTAPDANNTATESGNVYVYSRSANVFTLSQTIVSTTSALTGARFGTSLDIDDQSGNVFIGVPGSTQTGFNGGVVERWIRSGSLYVFKEAIKNPDNTAGAFGSSIRVSGDAKLLAVGSAGASADEITVFDNRATVIDTDTTQFVDYIINSGAVFMFESVVDLTNNANVYSYTQEIAVQVHSGDEFGTDVDLTSGIVVVGAPGTNNAAGDVHIFASETNGKGWNLTRQNGPRVDINTINRTFIYNKTNNNILSTIDYLDPIKGKVLSSVMQDIDYQRVDDPAYYNAGKGTISADYHWGPEQVGTIWWDLNSIRYIDYEQDSLIYRVTHWGQMFPGSQVLVYEWVESIDLPSNYTGAGTPVFADNSAYSTYGYVDQSGAVKVKYYFWVVNKDTIAEGKQNSVYNISVSIEDPQSQGVPYLIAPRNDTIAIYNINKKLTGQNTILHIGSKNIDAGLIHSEYALVQEGNPISKIPAFIEGKMIDSLAGQDQVGNAVPDPMLTPAQSYGVGIRPRQSMFINRELAWDNYLYIVNNYLQQYPVSSRKILTTLNSSEPIPGELTEQYDRTVNTVEELSYLNMDVLSPGYKVLVLADSTASNKWVIYELTDNVWVAIRTQSYKTDLYWNYVDWYNSDYNYTRAPDVTVANNLELGKLTPVAGQYIKVLSSADNKFVVYYVESNLSLTLVGIEAGTVQISTSVIPAKEMRQIMLSMQNEVFIDDLDHEYNRIFFAMIKYALTEQKNLDWVFKTSFLAATQYIRKLEQFPAYIADNQDYYRDYINEVKPYRTVLREFVVDYQKDDPYSGDVTDFDLPPYWDANVQMYRSPNGEQPYDQYKLTTGVYSQWNNNYKYQVVDIIVEAAGQDFLFAPEITISGGGGSGATAYATINASGGIANIYVSKPGTGYTSPPTIQINGTGTGARAYATLRNVYDGADSGHNVVRSIKTSMKFDRVSYTTTFVYWDQITTANVGQTLAANTIIVLDNLLYNLSNSFVINANVEFPTNDVVSITANDFDSANDRITAFNRGITLALTQEGIDYPGVIVDGNTYVGTEIDSIIQSAYPDDLGIHPSTINIDGGAYVDTFESHAPQEFVPGRTFNALDLKVFDTARLAFRIFGNTADYATYYRISNANTTVLTSNLGLTDTSIYVDNAAALTNPNREMASPGVIFVNGEKITYYRNYALEIPTAWSSNLVTTTGDLITYSSNTYITIGNVYGEFFSNIEANVEQITNLNVLSQIRRAVDGTSPATVQPAGSWVADAGIQQLIPGNSIEYVNITSNTAYTVTDAITYKIELTSNVSANVGDFITQIDANTASIISSMRVLQTVSNVKVIPVTLVDGSLQGLPDFYDNPLGFDYLGILGFDQTSSPIEINGVPTSSYVTAWSRLGLVDANGSITITPGTTLVTGNIWYNQGVTTATDGNGLLNSTKPAAEFLKASRGYTP